jgi:hypothetical protein
MNMKKYLLFGGDTYYPSGGWSDLKGTGDEVIDLIEQVAMSQEIFGWWQIVDITTMEIVKAKKSP